MMNDPLGKLVTPRSKILVVEDSAIFAMELQARLTDLGYEVAGVVDNTIDALVLARETHPDLILMDIIIQGHMDGILTAKLFSEMGIPIIYVTASTDSATAARAASTSPVGIVRKPLNGHELETLISRALGTTRET